LIDVHAEPEPGVVVVGTGVVVVVTVGAGVGAGPGGGALQAQSVVHLLPHLLLQLVGSSHTRGHCCTHQALPWFIAVHAVIGAGVGTGVGGGALQAQSLVHFRPHLL
jgi:hypothetical protein